MKKLLIVAAAFAAAASLRADTSYLLIQGPFGAGSTTATFKWQVNYPTGALGYGQDLLNSVFGTPTLNGIYTDGYSSTYPYYSAGDATTGAGYIQFSFGPLLASVTLGGVKVDMDPFYSPGFNYYVAGGSGSSGNPYASGAWTYSDDGEGTRTPANGSYDGWVFGSTYPAAPINGAGNTPTAANFSTATVINVPEPASAALLLIGAGGLLAFAKRRRA